MTAAPSWWSSSLQLADLGVRQTLRQKILIGVGLALLFAIGLATAIRVGNGDEIPENVQAVQLFIMTPVVAPLVALLLGTNALASEREGGTLTYLFTRPIPRAAAVIGKGVAAIIVADIAVALGVVAAWLAGGAPDTNVAGATLALVLETTALTGVFVLLGTIVARSLYLGLVYIALFEGVLGNTIVARAGTTITYHARRLLSEWSANALIGNDFPLIYDGSVTTSVLVLLVVPVASLAAAAWWVEKREYGLKDRPNED